jgi:hypothetical protein
VPKSKTSVITPLSDSISNYEVTYAVDHFSCAGHRIYNDWHDSNNQKGREDVAKIETLEWKPFFAGNIIEKNARNIVLPKWLTIASVTGAGIVCPEGTLDS